MTQERQERLNQMKKKREAGRSREVRMRLYCALTL